MRSTIGQNIKSFGAFLDYFYYNIILFIYLLLLYYIIVFTVLLSYYFRRPNNKTFLIKFSVYQPPFCTMFYANANISQGSVATHIRCGGTVSHHFLAKFSDKAY